MEEDNTAWRDLPVVLVPKTTSLDDLPICLVGDILSRLPVKTLIISTSVNKFWYSLIKNPKFISLHLKHSISVANKNGDSYILLTPSSSSTNSCALVNERTFSEESQFEIPFRTDSGLVQIYGSCNGLICLGDGFPFCFGRDFYLWNPSVKKYKHIDSSCYLDLLEDPLKTYAVIGFGFHDVDDDYRVLRIIFRSDDRCNFFGLKPKVEIYSVRTDSWRKVNYNVPRLVNHAHWVYVNGSFYWVESKRGNFVEWIVSFDLKKEVFEEFKLPRNFRRRVGKDAYIHLFKFKELLSICAFKVTEDHGVCRKFSAWVRRDNNGSVSWTEQFRVDLVFGWPLMFTNSGKLLLETLGIIDGVPVNELTNLVLYDLEKMKFKLIAKDGPYSGDSSFVESLLLFEGGKVPFKKRYKLADHGF